MGLVSKFRSNWDLEALVFVEQGKPENPKKSPRSRGRTNNKLIDYSHGNGTWVMHLGHGGRKGGDERLSTAPTMLPTVIHVASPVTNIGPRNVTNTPIRFMIMAIALSISYKPNITLFGRYCRGRKPILFQYTSTV